MTAPTVLIIEDDAALRALETRLAERAGFDVRTAPDGPTGLASALAEPPDVVVSDFHMPGMNGPELLRKLRQIPAMQSSPILMVTGDRSDSVRKNLVEAGADDVIVKPFPAADFRRHLVEAARRQGLEPIPRRRSRHKRPSKRAETVTAQVVPESTPATSNTRLMLVLTAALERPGRHQLNKVRNHIQRVRELSALLASAAGAPTAMVDQLREFAGLHDVGKSGLPDRLLRKDDLFSSLERQEMETHVLIGADMLQDAGLPEVAVQIARHHHERWDGRGYPQRLQGSQIPYAARVVSVADVYDALRSSRPYRPNLSPADAGTRLRSLAGTHLDPFLVEVFLTHSNEVEEIFDRIADPSPESDLEVWR